MWARSCPRSPARPRRRGTPGPIISVGIIRTNREVETISFNNSNNIDNSNNPNNNNNNNNNNALLCVCSFVDAAVYLFTNVGL